MDKYDRAVQYLRENPDKIYFAWLSPERHPAGCLFQFVSPTGKDEGDYEELGCLTQVHRGAYKAYTDELTEQIQADKRLANNPNEIEPEDLPVYAEWQRRLDREIRGIIPEVSSSASE